MRKTVGIGAAALLCAAVTAQAVEKDELARVGHGRVFYITNCASCHGPLGQGTGGARGEPAQAHADLTRIAERNDGRFDDLHVFQVIYGVYEVPSDRDRVMPVWGRVLARYQSRGDEWARATCGNLVAYVKSIQTIPQQTYGR